MTVIHIGILQCEDVILREVDESLLEKLHMTVAEQDILAFAPVIDAVDSQQSLVQSQLERLAEIIGQVLEKRAKVRHHDFAAMQFAVAALAALYLEAVSDVSSVGEIPVAIDL